MPYRHRLDWHPQAKRYLHSMRRVTLSEKIDSLTRYKSK
ncbi:hypothetical protein [Citrobacter pasteurii]|nr:hypothetical protein [Citrobacter pasteurii]